MQRMNATLLMGLAIAVGLATVSDALIVGWLAAGSAIVLIWILGTGTGALFSHRVLLKLFLLGLLLLALGVAFFATIQSGFLSMMSAEQGQAQVRIALWQHGIQVFLDSPIVGYGPGSYSWIRYPHARTEAHNTFIDLAASGGLVALVPFLLLMGAAIRRAFRAREAGLFGCIVYLVVFSSFHFMARHPLFWFLIFFVFLTPGQDGQKKFVIA
jgi:O-antigen ligase